MMMTYVGKSKIDWFNRSPAAMVLLLILLAFSLSSSAIAATLKATVDRNAITLDDTVRLTVRTDDPSSFRDPDFSSLQDQWDIFSQNQSRNMSYINGRMTSTKDWVFILAPKSQGRLMIPSFSYGSAHSDPIVIRVGTPGSAKSTSSQPKQVFIETEIDKSQLYVQEQLILTIKLYHSINLRSLTPPELSIDDTVVTKLSENQFEQVQNGIRYGVYQQQYAIFPQASGDLTIPSLTYSARVADRRNSFFNFSVGGGKRIRARTDKKLVVVLPKPSNYHGKHWLPAKNLVITESWSKEPNDVEIGEPITRTIVIQATGLASAQLPPSTLAQIPGLKLYPDQAQTEDQVTIDGLVGTRTESVAIVANQSGSYTLPAVKLHWWNTSDNTENIVKIPERNITVIGTAPTSPSQPNQNQLSPTAPGIALPQTKTVTIKQTSTHWGWIVATLFSTLAWLFTLWLYLNLKQSQAQAASPNKPKASKSWLMSDAKKALKDLANACHTNDPKQVKAALINWAQHHWRDEAIKNIAHIIDQTTNTSFISALNELEYVLYSDKPHSGWNGENLLTIVNGLTKSQAKPNSVNTALPALYN